MLRFTINRLITGAVVVLAVSTITFLLLRILPGGPFDTDKVLPKQIQLNIEKKYKLTEPLPRQLGYYLLDLAQGDFGPSYKYIDRSVNDIISTTLPVSLSLGVMALALSIFVGISIGAISAAKPRGALDLGGAVFSTALVSVPSFVIGALLVYIFAVRLGWLPAALWGKPSHFVLPVITLAAGPTAYLARLVRGSMLEVSEALFVRTAKAKGLSRLRIVLKHILRNALIPVITVLGPIAAYLITGSFVVEHIFEIPGMGKFFVNAVSNRDYPLVMGITVVYTVILVSANLIVDLCYFFVDPRISLGRPHAK